MKKTFWIFMAWVTMLTCTGHAMAETTESLTGTWMIDTKATEESVIRTRPFKDVSRFTYGIHLFGTLTFELDGTKLLVGMVPNNLKKDEYLQVSGEASEMKFVKKDNKGAGQVVIAVSILNDKNITIAFEGYSEMQYLLWKRVNVDPSKTTPNDFKPELDAFFMMMKNIERAFGSRQ